MLLFGLGPIGASIAKLALERKETLKVIGAIDINPSLEGKDLGEVLGIGTNTGIHVNKSGRSLYADADVVLHATTSFLNDAFPQLSEFCENGVDVVSTCEELSYPWHSREKLASDLDAIAKKNNATLLGTGVNPGFVMDALPITLSGACHSVSQVKVTRILDAEKRRLPFQKKVGIGLSVSEFEESVRTGRFGHIGLPESMAMVCSALGIKVEKIEQKISPKVAVRETSTTNFGRVPAGNVLGLVQDGRAFGLGGKLLAEYHIEMYAGAQEPRDEIQLIAKPSNIMLKIPGGTPGDPATAALVVNSIDRVVEASPGLYTVRDLRPATSVFSF